MMQTINIGTMPNDGTGDTFIDGWKKVNSNFERLSKVFNLKLERVKETNNIEDIRNNMIIINENFKLIEKRTEL